MNTKSSNVETMLIDDDKHGYQDVIVRDVKTALKLINHIRPLVLYLDYSIPDRENSSSTGIDFLRKLSESYKVDSENTYLPSELVPFSSSPVYNLYLIDFARDNLPYVFDKEKNRLVLTNKG